MNSNESSKPSIKSDRKRSNFLKNAEYTTISYLCKIMPRWVTPDMLTAFGVFGAVVVFFGLQLAKIDKLFLLLSILGLAIHWFGDSLDGRIAYYRNTPRKWYGWALDIHADWLAIIIIGLGFYFYFPYYNFVAFLFVAAYGGAMIIALLRYKINNQYIIDSNYFGPTELRIVLSAVLFLEILFPYILLGFGMIGTVLLVVFNTIDSIGVLKAGDVRDLSEKSLKTA
jgi:phosphatidylglycerophosphate synthase